MRSGDCLCAAGYTPNNDYTQCDGKYTLVGSKLKTSYEIDAILIWVIHISLSINSGRSSKLANHRKYSELLRFRSFS